MFNQFLNTKIICICPKLIVNSQEPTACHTSVVTSLPVVSSDLRSAARFVKPYGSAQCKFDYAIPNRWGHQ